MCTEYTDFRLIHGCRPDFLRQFSLVYKKVMNYAIKCRIIESEVCSYEEEERALVRKF